MNTVIMADECLHEFLREWSKAEDAEPEVFRLI